MKNWWKAAGGLAAMSMTAAAVAWYGALPDRPQPEDWSRGRLGQAVSSICDPDRRGPFTPDQLKDALTCRDLAAQESMALSTKRLVWLSWLQIFVAVAGAAAVVWTIILTLRSLSLTRDTLKLQQTATRLQLRPTFVGDPPKIEALPGGRARVSLLTRNKGETTARRYSHALVYKVVPKGAPATLNGDFPNLFNPDVEVTKGAPSGMHFQISAPDYVALKAGTHAIQYAYAAIFDDDLGGRYKYLVRREISGADLGTGRRLADFHFTLPVFEGREL